MKVSGSIMPPHLRNNNLQYLHHRHYEHDLEHQQQASSTTSHYDKSTTLNAHSSGSQSPLSTLSPTNLGGQRRKLMTYTLLMIILEEYCKDLAIIESFC